jgi:hypothetical protein
VHHRCRMVQVTCRNRSERVCRVWISLRCAKHN